MRRASLPSLIALVLTGVVSTRPAMAQVDDVTPLRSGTLRVGLTPDWSRWDQRFGRGTPGLPAGSREPLAVDFSTDSLGVAQLPFLGGSQDRLRQLTGLSGYNFNLGRARLTLNASWRTIPLTLEYALSSRLVVGASIPIVRARMEAVLQAHDSTRPGNVGLNPALLSPGSWDAFRGQVDAALAALLDQANNGPDALRPQAQATLLAIQPLLCGLYTLAAGNAELPASLCYDNSGPGFSAVLPMDTTQAGQALANLLMQARTDYNATAAAYQGQGITLPAFDAAFTLPSGHLDSTDLRNLVLSRRGPLAGDSLTTVVRTRLGDIETGAWYQLVDRPRFRTRLSLLIRWPTGWVDSPNSFIDLGTGDGQLDLELGMRNDVVLGDRFLVHLGGSYGMQFPHRLERRVAPASLFLPPAASLALLERDPGDYVVLNVTPRWRLDDAFSLGIGYNFYRRGTTRHSYVDPSDEARIGLAASVLDEETGVTATRISAGVTFSTLARHAQGHTRVPYTVTASFTRTFHGDGGNVPDLSAFNLSLKAYIRLR
jgi:hypothetical protein